MIRNQLLTGDNLEVMRTLPDGCCDLTLTSPPYEDARTYSIGFKYAGQDWVDWMIPRVIEMCRVTKGLVLVNAAGKVRDFKYSPIMEWLVADLTRIHGLVCGPAPYVFYRIGIPGSGGPHYHRRDWEPVYAFARPENLPPSWSDNTCMGHPPKWAPGGEMSNRTEDGRRKNAEISQNNPRRVNQWGHSIDSGATVVAEDGVVRSKGKRPSHKLAGRDQWGNAGKSSGEGRNADGSRKTRPRPVEHNGRMVDRTRLNTEPDGSQREQGYTVPVLANPGNVIQERYTAEEVAKLLEGRGDVVKCLVGGGVMGDRMAHENEAPFPETLVEFFVRSFCPEGGLVIDPFSGSGTVAKVAQRWGRDYLGIDVRESQVKLGKRRLRQHGSPLLEGLE